MRVLLSLLALAILSVSAANAQETGYQLTQYSGGRATCRLSPEMSARHTGGARDCTARRVDPDGRCYCPSAAGPIEGRLVRPQRYQEEGPLVRCRVSRQNSQYRDGSRDCNVRRVDPDGTCYCNSNEGMLPGRVINVD